MARNRQPALGVPAAPPTYWLTRFVLLRLLGALYAVAFLVAINQVLPLIGADGLLPVGPYLQQVSEALGGTGAGFARLPSLFWFWHSDAALLAATWVGLGLSCAVVAGYANAVLLAVLWVLYLSLVHVGQEWYGYGWEIQLCETGFLAIFLCPLLDGRPFPRTAPPQPIIVLFRWLVVRIMLGAGLIKLRGDASWLDATALYYHFETQPLPGPLSRWFHLLPHAVLRAGVWYNWLAELGAPFFAFGPRVARQVAGGVMIGLQLILLLSGNLSFLNWLTILPALACFDDGFWARVLPGRLVRRAQLAAAQAEVSRPLQVAAWVATAVLAVLSIRPVLNLVSPQQVMNTSFDPFDLVNTYGAFGTVGQQRLNIVFEGTLDDNSGDNSRWRPYPYKGLPVALTQRPPQVAPYQLHLDWQLWFAAMGTPKQYPWAVHLLAKLLRNDPRALSLFAANPFPTRPPRYVRAVLYRYRFARPGNAQGRWWQRERLGLWLIPLSADDPRLLAFLQAYGWVAP
ncbi:lipase maturation factor family protein [Hymenobacter sp. RP-2-7]|uniref:Lipase maturation factor family protein n=1 Tax=Hymenobacter polaris TaxID=2682546 RepID=A0A7Y0FNM6_9BACT|nr:lipase maturation factor family protein [Hymenobacter polaris]NML67122.1 lipase maturation factor family protein [Hymenobacter polaris]